MSIHVNIHNLTAQNRITAQAHGLDIAFPAVKPVDMSQVGLNALGKDSVGRPYFMDVEIESKKLALSWRLPFEPLVRISRRKKLVKTPIVGSSKDQGGVVVEQISTGNWDIQIRGILQLEDKSVRRYPSEQVEKLARFENVSDVIDVRCDLLELFHIRKMIITSIAFDEMQGQPYSQRYVINAMSYVDFYAQTI